MIKVVIDHLYGCSPIYDMNEEAMTFNGKMWEDAAFISKSGKKRAIGCPLRTDNEKNNEYRIAMAGYCLPKKDGLFIIAFDHGKVFFLWFSENDTDVNFSDNNTTNNLTGVDSYLLNALVNDDKNQLLTFVMMLS